MKKEKIDEIIAVIEMLIRLLQKRGKNVGDHYGNISGISAELWWQSLRSILEEDFKTLSSKELCIVADLIFEKMFQKYEAYAQDLIVLLIQTEKIEWIEIVRLWNKIGSGEWNYEVTECLKLEECSRSLLNKMAYMTSVNFLIDHIVSTKKLSDRTVYQLIFEQKIPPLSMAHKYVNWEKFSSKRLCAIAQKNSSVFLKVLETNKLTRLQLTALLDYYATQSWAVSLIIKTKKLSSNKMLQIIANKKILITSSLISDIIQTGSLNERQNKKLQKIYESVSSKEKAEERSRNASWHHSGGGIH